MTKTNFGLTVKNKVLLGYCENRNTYTLDNTGKCKSAFTACPIILDLKSEILTSALIDTLRFERIPTANLKANVSKTAHISTLNLSHRLTGQVIVKNDVKVQPQTEDMLQPPTADEHVNNVNICQHPYSVIMPFTPTGEIRIRRKGLSTFQHSPMTKVKYLQTFTQIEEVPKVDQTIAFDNSLLRNFRNALRARTGRETHLKDKKVIAKDRLNNYPSRALSKILRLVLTGYILRGVQSIRAFFVRNISMRLHIYVELWRDTFECAGNLVGQSVNLLQLRANNYLTVISEAPELQGVHTHA